MGLNWEEKILFCIWNGAEYRPQIRQIESPVLACDLNLIVIELGCRRSIAFLLTCLRSCKFAVPERKIDITKKVSLEHFNDLTTETCFCCKNDIKFIGSDACIYSQLKKEMVLYVNVL